MSLIQNKQESMKHKKHIYENFDEFYNDTKDANERVRMKVELEPLIKDLSKNGIDKQHDFCKIFKKYNFNMVTLTKLLNRLNQEMKIIKRTRTINKTNTSDKNVIFTYFAYYDHQAMTNFFFSYINDNIKYPESQKPFLAELSNEIDKVKKRNIDDDIETFDANYFENISDNNNDYSLYSSDDNSSFDIYEFELYDQFN